MFSLLFLLYILLLVFSQGFNQFVFNVRIKNEKKTFGKSTVLHMTSKNKYESNYRFWKNSIRETVATHNITTEVEIVEYLKEIMKTNNIDANKLETGVAILKSMNLIVPIHDGIVQSQHIQPLSDEINEIIFLGFSPRAKHVSISPTEEERPVDIDRYNAIIQSLLWYSNTTVEELMSEKLAGTPPARILRSFVAPRPTSNFIIEPIERASNRTALQIEMAMRQVRADLASYLRNNDKSLNFLTKNNKSKPLKPVILVLDNIRSAFNVGSMFRTGETAGISELITCGITAHPPNPKLKKTAFSSVDIVPTKHYDDIMTAIFDLKQRNYKIVVMETTSRSQIYSDIEYPENIALILGNEVTGVDTRVMDQADLIVEIPTYGIKNSLNVASAAPIVLFEILRQWDHKNK